jgi:hypothetical protein
LQQVVSADDPIIVLLHQIDQEIEDLLHFTMLSVDEESHNVHVLFKFATNEKIILHRHMIHNNTFVVQGEHRLYEPDGTLREIRPTGMYKSTPAVDTGMYKSTPAVDTGMYKSTPAVDMHREGGGPDQDVDCVVRHEGPRRRVL